MTLPNWVPGAILFVVACATGWLVWQLRDSDEPEPLYGPPRSDYLLLDYDLVSLDDTGTEAFRVSGPMMARHPHLGTLDAKAPRFLFPDSEGGRWNASADDAWVSERADELRLVGTVEFDGPPATDGARIQVRTEALTVRPRESTMSNEVPVTVTGAGSILRGRALRADLNTRRFQLSEVNGRYAPPSP